MGAKLKRLKRPSNAAAKAKSATASSGKKKSQRGPKAYIAAAGDSIDGSDQEGEEGQEAALQEALDAEDMVADGTDSEAAGSDDEDSGGEASSGKRTVKPQPRDPNAAGFLLKLDKKGISRSRAEEARLKKAERRAQKADSQGASSHRAQAADGDDSDAGSTDMEGASEGSDDSDQDDSDDDGFDSLEASDFDSQQSFSDESSDGEDQDEDAAERRYAEKLRAQRKRQKAEEAHEAMASKRRRLPVRGEQGKWKEEDDDEDGSGDEGRPSGRKVPQNRAVHELQGADLPSSDDEEDESERQRQRHHEPASSITSGARFGMQAPYSIMLLKPKSARMAAAREQIARLSTDIVGDPEVSLGLLRRLSVFAQSTISRPEHDSMAKERNLPTRIEADDAIRAAAVMSLTAVYVDILPGYRIRALTDKELEEKVNQETARRREWEQGLVKVYRDHLEICESLLRAKVTISSVALRSMCVLLTRATHFNYRTNLIGALVSQLSRKGWSPDSQQSADSLVEVLRRDLTGEASLEVVRLLNRMIKERHFKVNARVLNILLHLRLRDELGNKRAGTTRADRNTDGDADGLKKKNGGRFQSGKGKAKPKDVRKGKGEHLSKKEIKKQREVREVEKEMREAEAEVDKEERERNHTETLKLLFVLYFSILKAPQSPGPLLGAALEGLARFAHRVNVDFFRDLVAVLRKHIEDARVGALSRNTELKAAQGGSVSDEEEDDEDDEVQQADYRKALLCLVTAFELLSGQGEALNIDLADLVAHLYAVILPLCASPTIEETPATSPTTPANAAPTADTTGKGKGKGGAASTTTHLLRTDADLLLRALDLTLLRPRAMSIPAERTAAFAKRLAAACLQTPPTTTLRLLGVVRALIGKDPRLEALLESEDRARNGQLDITGEDLEAARPLAAGEVIVFELVALASHVNEDIAAAAKALLAWQG